MFLKGKDKNSKWSRVLEEMGESIEIRFGVLERGCSKPEWIVFSHKEVDGVGAFALLLRKRYPGVQIPTRSKEKIPRLIEQLKLMCRFLKLSYPWQVNWRRFDYDWIPVSSEESRSKVIGWKVFTEDQTLSIKELARRKGASMNSYLLWGLDRGVSRLLTKEDPQRLWVVPVNMRGPVSLEPETCNQVADLWVILRDDDLPDTVHQSIRHQINDGMHWASWNLMNLCASLGPRVMKKFLKPLNPHIGIFTNLGAWKTPKDRGEAWLFVPVVRKGVPFGAGAISFNGRLALTLSPHPSLSCDPKDADTWMNAWVKQILTE